MKGKKIVINEVLTICDEIKGLIREYGSTIYNEEQMAALEQELLEFDKLYTRPQGVLFTAEIDGEKIGCIAYKTNTVLGDKVCEIKRFFVKNEYRSLGAGNLLIDKLLKTAREMGFEKTCLNTYKDMDKAVSLYEGYGFYRIEPYFESSSETILYFCKDL